MILISSLFILSLQSMFPTSLAKPSSSCPPSACGIIPNISSPLRLKGAPNHCGDRRLELVCENNVPSIYLNSHKYYVKDINYHNQTIRLVDASINNDDTCSFPNSSAYAYNFTYPYPQSYPYRIRGYRSPDEVAWPINLMSCPTPLKNSSLFTDITHHCASHPRFTYIKVGHMNASEVPTTCGVELIVMTSWIFNDSNNVVSLLEIHHSLLYGFELSFCLDCTSIIMPAWEKFSFFFQQVYWIFVILLAIIAFILAGVSLPLMIVIGFILSFILIRDWALTIDRYSFQEYAAMMPNFETVGIISSIIIGAPRFIICPLAVWLLICKFRRKNLSFYEGIECFLQSENKLMPIRYSYSDIRKMTKGLQEKIGEGGYGSVYKGKLRSGHHVAVKLLGKSKANSQDFINEIATIGRIHHVNVINLVGYCVEGSKRALVFDFMPNGSLEKYIFNVKEGNSLNWDTKFEIAIGVARGIEYLHRGCDVQILHFDIKPHNILLDNKYIPKITDFGLAKFCATNKNSVTMTTARGTIGYVAPELISRSIGAISYKADVYSFGMLLMEMVGLNRVLTGNNGDSNLYFPYWIYDYFNQGKDIEILKAGEYNENDENDSTRKLVRKMTIVALWCIQMNPDDRPSMNKVLQMLEDDVERLQIPNYPSQSTQIVVNMDQTTRSTDSVSMLYPDDVSSCFEITVQQ